MPAKRKRDLSISAGKGEANGNSGAVAEPLKLPNVEKYPRKRISVACNLCRYRKTKCDAVRPSCGFCSNLGVECQYRNAAPSTAVTEDAPAPAGGSVQATISPASARQDVDADPAGAYTYRPPSHSASGSGPPTGRHPSTNATPEGPFESDGVAGPSPSPSESQTLSSIERRLAELEAQWKTVQHQQQFPPQARPGTDSMSAPSPASHFHTPGSLTSVQSPPAMFHPPGTNNASSPSMHGVAPVPTSRNTALTVPGLLSPSHPSASINTTTFPTRTVPNRRSSNVSTSSRPSFPVPTYRAARSNEQIARPGMLRFHSPSYLDAETWDDVRLFYDAELDAGARLHARIRAALGGAATGRGWWAEIGGSTVGGGTMRDAIRDLLMSFLENFLGWMPVFDAAYATGVVESAVREGFQTEEWGGTPEQCLAMFILAVGAITQCRADSEVDLEDSDAKTAQAAGSASGFEYFALGSRRLESLDLLVGDLTVVHCRLLQSTYLKLALHPVLAWNAIATAMRNVMHVFSSQRWRDIEPEKREAWHRVFWASSIYLDQFEAAVHVAPVGHHALQETVPLPRFENEDTGFYYFLAQISLRKLMTEMLATTGHQSGKVIYAPVITTELRNQVLEWHGHLPAAIRFPGDETPLLDGRKSHLRLQYFSSLSVLNWASVLRVLEAYDNDKNGKNGAGPSSTSSDDLDSVKREAREFYSSSTLYVRVAEEQLLAGWKLGAQAALWSCFMFLGSFIVTYRVPALSFIPETRQPEHARALYEILRVWAHVGYVERALARMREMMERRGMW